MALNHKQELMLDGFSAQRTAIVAAAAFSRPANTTQYAAGDLVANNATAGNVVPLEFEAARLPGRGGRIIGGEIHKSSTTATNAGFSIQLFAEEPTPANGDNGAFSTDHASYLGAISIDMTSGAVTFAAPDAGLGEWSAAVDIPFQCAEGSKKIYGLLRQDNATGYTPASGETFTVRLAVRQD